MHIAGISRRIVDPEQYIYKICMGEMQMFNPFLINTLVRFTVAYIEMNVLHCEW